MLAVAKSIYSVRYQCVRGTKTITWHVLWNQFTLPSLRILPILITSIDDNITFSQVGMQAVDDTITDGSMGQREDKDFGGTKALAETFVEAVLLQSVLKPVLLRSSKDLVHGLFGWVVERNSDAVLSEQESHVPTHAATPDHGQLKEINH